VSIVEVSHLTEKMRGQPMEEEFDQVRKILDIRAPDPRAGLPRDVFLLLSRFVPMVNVDLVIRNDAAHTLLTWREDEFDGPGWHLPGGVIRYKETAEERIRATAREELDATVEFDPIPIAGQQLIVPDRSERGHFVSLAYRCRLTSAPPEALWFAGGKPVRGQWAWHEQCPPNLILAQDAYRRILWSALAEG
jgi:ADP-ribose pyrophosphatase YjhB (NUDIX family)